MVNLENLLLFLTVVWLRFGVIMELFSSRYFKKHEADYNQLLSDYRRNGYDLDLVTNYASFFGSLKKNQKIIIEIIVLF